MRSKEERTSEREQKEKCFLRKRRVVLLVCAAILTAEGVLALYIFSFQGRAELESRFHISSNYLKEGGGASYSVEDWGGGFDILLYNYEKEDIAQLSTVDMTYKVTAEHGAVSVRKQNGEDVPAAAGGVYSFETEPAAAYHVLHVSPDAGAGENEAITVTVETAYPCQKTLTAEFRTQGRRKPDYTVTDQNDGTILVTVHTNDYQDTMTVTWKPDKYSPDTTGAIMASWTEDASVGHFPVSSDTTYELLFYKKTNDSYAEQKGAATVITLD